MIPYQDLASNTIQSIEKLKKSINGKYEFFENVGDDLFGVSFGVQGLAEKPSETITTCKEALLSLDIAAEDVFRVTKLTRECSMAEASRGYGVQLQDEANELLPKINATIVKAITRLSRITKVFMFE
ncbi:hypothetical protein V6N13_041330 [Hibiscus sabdariffa]|uniref:Pectinesterase inhibitor domain-containing protein n=1 Tax=Hibiscus sabdariffa TaxID=183260 RepID=A0ABR2RBH8_9ROSI